MDAFTQPALRNFGLVIAQTKTVLTVLKKEQSGT